MLYSMRALNVNVVNGGGIARRSGRAAGSLLGFGFACAAFLLLAKIAAIFALIVLSVVLVVRLCQAAPPVPKQYDRVNDAAARAHRARMAAIRDGRTAARFEGQPVIVHPRHSGARHAN